MPFPRRGIVRFVASARIGARLGIALVAGGAVLCSPPPLPGRAAGAVPQKTPTTLAVMPFAPRVGQGQGWLSKGLADLLIQDLAQVTSLAIVSREETAVFTRELELGESALVGEENALRLGRVAKVDRVIYGHYSVEGDRIIIAILVLDMSTQQAVQRADISGRLDDLRSLIHRLALQFVGRQGIALSDAERRNIGFNATDTFTATRHFYEGVHLYDQGRPADAFGEFAAAARQDPRFHDARLWMAKAFETLGRHEHALLTYRDLSRDAPATVEGLDAHYFAGRLLEGPLGRPAEAIEAYTTLASMRPPTPHALEAAFRLGVLLEAERRDRDAYEALRIVDGFREQVQRDPSILARSRLRASRFLGWSHALELSRDAIVRMVVLYQRIVRTSGGPTPPPPRGVVIVSPDHPSLGEPFGKSASLLQRRDGGGSGWNERYYAVVVPAGYVATGVELTIRGRLVVSGPHYSYGIRVLDFPLPRDFSNRWLGAIYGQTREVTTLKKTISFHGDDRTIFTIQLMASQAEIDRWAVNVRLRPEKEPTRPAPAGPARAEEGTFWEGRPLGRISLPRRVGSGWTRPSSQALHGPQKELTLTDDGRGGFYLVAVEGELDGQPTDLWWSQSRDGRRWSDLAPLPINSASEDYNPHLVRAEDGTLWLYWISTRRGRGWELWASVSRDGRTWSDPRRIPLERFVEARRASPGVRPVTDVIEYDVLQDRRGRWLAAFYWPDTREMVFIRSEDGAQWSLLARIPVASRLYGPALVEDRGGVYRMAALSDGDQVHLWSSNDAVAWRPRSFSIDSPYGTVASVHRNRLFALPDGALLLLVSDTIFGLQYARFRPDGDEPRLDLVSRASLEAFAAASAPAGGYLVALRQSDEILVRQYRTFNATGVGVKKYERDWPIYVEEDRDPSGNGWRRITARARIIIPDVTGVGVEPGGRVWWGIESGVMATNGEEFFATDVSQGFFYHYVNIIKGCGEDSVWFAADHLERPVVGYVRPRRAGLLSAALTRFETRVLSGASGAVTAVECGSKPGEVYVGTSRGDVLRLNGGGVTSRWSLDGTPHITALAVERNTGIVWIGTKRHGLHEIRHGSPRRVRAPALPDGEVTALTADAAGGLWLALDGKGLMRRAGDQWVTFTPANSGLPDWSIGRLVADPVRGVWYIAHPEARSRGVGYFDGTLGQLHNPPHRLLDRPSSLAVDPRGHVWIGTWFDGLYELAPARTGR